MASTMKVTTGLPQQASLTLTDEKHASSMSTNEAEMELLSNEESKLLSKAMEFCKTDLRTPASCQRLDRVVAIPQITKGFDKPFTRAYSQELSHAGVPAETFIAFIDSVNILTMAHPILKTLSVAGGLAGYAPSWEALVAGIAVQAVSDATSYALIYYRVKRFIKQANAVYFNPRGLKVRIGTSAELANILGFSSPQDMVPELAAEHMSLTVAERRMLGLQDLVAELDCRVQQEVGNKGVFDKISMWSMKRAIITDEGNLLKSRNKCARRQSWYVPGMGEATPITGGRAKKREARREAKEKSKQAKAEQKILLKGGDLDSYRHRNDSNKVKDKERESVSKLRWLLIENL